jgi:hypothetical protein
MTGTPRLSIAALRDAVRRRVDDSSLRAVADEIGVSYSGLGSFVRGDTSSPNRRTWDRLVRWYVVREQQAASVPKEEIALAIAVLRTYIHDETKAKTVQERRRRDVIDDLTGESK